MYFQLHSNYKHIQSWNSLIKIHKPKKLKKGNTYLGIVYLKSDMLIKDYSFFCFLMLDFWDDHILWFTVIQSDSIYYSFLKGQVFSYFHLKQLNREYKSDFFTLTKICKRIGFFFFLKMHLFFLKKVFFINLFQKIYILLNELFEYFLKRIKI